MTPKILGPWYIMHLLPVIHSDSNLGIVVKGICRCKDGLNSVDLKIIQVDLT